MKVYFKKQEWLNQLVFFIIAISLYTMILLQGIPGIINNLIWAQDSTILALLIGFMLYIAYRPAGWLGNLTSLTGTLVLFALQLAGIWQNGLGKSAFILGGIITLTDTDAYYTSALRLLEGETFTVVGSWRPLAQGFFATILAITGQNLQLSLAILVLITAIACYFLAREIQQHQGTVPAVLTLVTIFLFYRIYLGAVSTESLGLALGCLSLAALWSAIFKSQASLFILGLFFLSVAMMTRAGTILVLPALIIWGTWNFKGTSRWNVQFAIGSVAIVFLGFILNSIIFKLVGDPQTGANSNFSYSLYGLLVGGDWLTVFSRYPEIKNLPDKEQARQVYTLAWEYLQTHPISLFKGMLRAWQQFIFEDFVFSFVESTKINILLQILTSVTLIQSIRQRKTLIGSFILVLSVGILLSVPFIPPWDARTRPYAATIPFFALFPALGLFYVAQRLQWQNIISIPKLPPSTKLIPLFGLSLVCLTIFGTIALRLTHNPPQLAQITCPSGLESVYFRKVEGSSINIVDDSQIKNSYAPNFRLSDFQKMLEQYRNRYAHHPQVPELIDELKERVNANTSILRRLNLKTGKTIWIITERNKIPSSEGIVGVCGKPSSNAALKNPTAQYLEFLFYL